MVFTLQNRRQIILLSAVGGAVATPIGNTLATQHRPTVQPAILHLLTQYCTRAYTHEELPTFVRPPHAKASKTIKLRATETDRLGVNLGPRLLPVCLSMQPRPKCASPATLLTTGI